MLTDIYIEGFRGIRSMELNNLHPINLMIGENNSGKTSVLEAIQLLKGPDVLASLYQVANIRDNPVREPFARTKMGLSDLIAFSFHDLNHPYMIVRGHDMHHGVICAEMEGEVYDYISREPSRYMEYDEDGFSHTFRGAFRYGNQRSGGWIHFDLGENIRIRRNSEMLIPMVYLNPILSQVQLSSVKSMYNALRVREKDELIHLLQYFDQRIVGMERAGNEGRMITFLELDDGQLMPLSAFGDGIKKVLAIANAVVKAKGGVILVDEFETGIHKKALPAVAEWLYNIAEENETQVFLTTHSEDAMRALTDVERNDDMLSIYRLEHYRDNIYVKQFVGEMIREIRKRGSDIF